MRRQNLSQQSIFPIKDPTVRQISDKDVQCFLCLVAIILNSEKEKNSSYFRKNVNNTHLTAKLIAMT